MHAQKYAKDNGKPPGSVRDPTGSDRILMIRRTNHNGKSVGSARDPLGCDRDFAWTENLHCILSFPAYAKRQSRNIYLGPTLGLYKKITFHRDQARSNTVYSPK